MEVNILREKLTDYIKVADEKKLEAIYTLLENDIEGEYKWYEDEAFVSQMEEDLRRMDSGEEPGFTMEEVSGFLREQKMQRYAQDV